MATRKPAARKTQIPRKRASSSGDANGQVAALQRELAEERAQRAAMTEILESIASTPKEAQRALNEICETAVRLFNASSVGIRRVEGNVLRSVAWAGPATTAAYAAFPDVPLESHPAAAAILQRRQLYRDDIANPSGDEELAATATESSRIAAATGARSAAATPLMREGEAIGVLNVLRNEVRPFTPSELESMRGFADQAVIAIENARLLEELHARNRDQAESLEQQIATSEILRSIASSPGEAERSVQTIAETAGRLFDAHGVISLVENGVFRQIATADWTRSQISIPKLTGTPVDRGSVSGRVVLEGRVIHYEDIRTLAAELPRRSYDVRTIAAAPMMRDGEAIGAVVIARTEVRPFTDKDLRLLQSFADQAVIAIENDRLLEELNTRNHDLAESLERQEATSEILQTIASNPIEAGQALQNLCDTTLRLFGASSVAIRRFDGNVLRAVAAAGLEGSAVNTELPDVPFDPAFAGVHAILERRQIHAGDLMHPTTDEQVEWSGSEPYRLALAAGTRSIALTPLIRQEDAIGILIVYRNEVRPFTDSELALLRNFADQAVIAIENARVLNELDERNRDLRESLEQQTATSEVLRSIASSPGDAERVLATIASTTQRLFRAWHANITLVEGGFFRDVVGVGTHTKDIVGGLSGRPVNTDTVVGRAVLERRVIQVVDIRGSGLAIRNRYEDSAVTVASAPLLSQGEAIGAISLSMGEARPLSDAQLELLQSFADQAVIAIENARLLTELRARTNDLAEALKYQTATSDVLKLISRSTFDLQPVLDTLVDAAVRLCNGDSGGLTLVDGATYRYVSASDLNEEFAAFLLSRSFPVDRSTMGGRAAVEGKVVQIADVTNDPEYRLRETATMGNLRTLLGVPMLRDGAVIGTLTLCRTRVASFNERQVDLVRTFADQAVIAIENARLLTELRDSLEHQTATANVLEVISTSTGELEPVFQAILDSALRLAEADSGILCPVVDDKLVITTIRDQTRPEWAAFVRQSMFSLGDGPESMPRQVLQSKEPRQRLDMRDAADYRAGLPAAVALTDNGGLRTVLFVPIVREDRGIGIIGIYRREVRAFEQEHIDLVAGFARQAAIAIENARLLTELRESLDQQTATSEVLRAISSSPGNVDPVFRQITTSAARICETEFSSLQLYEGDELKLAAMYGVLPDTYRDWMAANPGLLQRAGPNTITGQVAAKKRTVHITDYSMDAAYFERDPLAVHSVEQMGVRTCLGVPIIKDDKLLGLITVFRREVRPFTDKQIELVENFAAQAVIAIENARLLTELRARTDELAQRQAELRVTFDNMGDGVVMFDKEQRLAAWNRNLQEVLDIPDPFFAEPKSYRDWVAFLIGRGELGEVDFEKEWPRYLEMIDAEQRIERTRPDGRVLEIRVNPVPGGGFVIIYSDVTERRRAEDQIRTARDAAERALSELKTAQASLIQAEKMASLGQLTAGIAHEIKNPLNFVNNFAGLSVELLDDLKDAQAAAVAVLDAEKRAEIDETIEMLTGNLTKIAEHGQRADGIVKSMLAHSRGGSGERQEVSLNGLVEEALNLAYHGARAQDQEFNITMEREFDPALGPIEVVPQDLTRVFLNLFGNGFYAANKRQREGANGEFRPTLKVMTHDLGAEVVIRVRDNGVGIPPDVRDKLFQPFFTTKPTGEGTGLGLSISYEIVTNEHGGTIEVESEPGEFTEFIISIPKRFGATSAENANRGAT